MNLHSDTYSAINHRKEPFRYSLELPLPCAIEINEINGKAMNTKLAEAELIDLSRGGCKIRIPLDLHASAHTIRGKIHLQLNEEKLIFNTEIRWQNSQQSDHYLYGLALYLNTEDQEKLNAELRTMAGSNKIKVN
ncbi:hypothetical protein J2Z69_001464 [Paenibacillus shirakamiensis]|uniref:PilZ domain-containing protein n=1 Tax=Paenibacillus shirakamiensis TaxID=1265935 RepID=A0ABS4JFE2_9BACL|nr:PilZ domain-containing protein [Paenibacillus shirakamiensis]MBP2000433.1 hypothetical protein [Paenibacillus shirakamiensis]